MSACGPASHVGVDFQPIANQNILLITIDTLRADALGSYGGRASTPALDRLAADGVRFDFAHAHAVVTLPSHTTILTGVYPFQHGVRDNAGFRLGSGARTAATLFKQAGYATAAFVAAFPLHSRFGLNQGFDVYDDRFGQSHAPEEFGMPERPASAVVPLARQWIGQHPAPVHPAPEHPAPEHPAPEHPAPITSTQHPAPDTKHPWFAWVHLFDPHAPYLPSYQGEVEKVDAALAPLFDDLRRLATPTFVVVTADHGESLGEHGEQTHGLFAYEATLRVPLIMAAIAPSAPQSPSPQPPAPRPGEVSSVAARHIDLLPTLLAAAGLAIPSDLPGRSLLAANERTDEAAPRTSYFEAMSGMVNRGTAPLAGVLAGREKLIDLPIAERYDLASDRREMVNLAGRTPDRDRTLEALLRGFRAAPPVNRSAETADAAERLRALGYASGGAAPRAKYTEADDPKAIVELDAAVHRAVDAAGSGRLEEAIDIYKQVIARRPDFSIAYRHLAFLERQRGNVDGAIAVLQRGVRSAPPERSMLTQLAGYLADSGRVGQSIDILEPLARDPNADADTLNTLGIAYAQAGRAADARRTFERVLAIDPRSSIPLANLGLLALERGDRRAAIDTLTRAVELDSRNFDALFNLATALLRNGERDRAQPLVDRFVREAPASYAGNKRTLETLMARHAGS